MDFSLNEILVPAI